MRILFHSESGFGHLFPLLPFARAARAAGDDVHFAVPAAGVATVEGFGYPTTALPPADPDDLGRAWAQVPQHDVNTYVVAEIFVRLQAAAVLPALSTAIRTHAADLVITTEFGGIVAAELTGVPNVLVGITALDLPDLNMTRVSAALDDLRDANGLPRTGRPPYANGGRYVSALPPMLWADESHIPPGWIWYRHQDPEGEAPPVGPRRHHGRPRVYATLGSMAGGNDFGRPVFVAMLTALGRLDADVTFTIGPFDRDRLGEIPPNVTVAAYAPQAEAMASDVVVSHAGSGTTVAALARGLPMVAVPMFADQFHNADRLVTAGIGLRVDPRQVPEELTPAIEQVINEPRYRTSAQRVATAIRSRPSPADALDLLRP